MTNPNDNGPRFRGSLFSFLPANRSAWIIVLALALVIVIGAAAMTMLGPQVQDARWIAVPLAVLVIAIMGFIAWAALTRTTWGRRPPRE